MTTTHFYQRKDWTAVARPVHKLTPLDAATLRGVAVHYTGDKGRLGDTPTYAQTVARLEGERVFHTAAPPKGRGWSDIAYSVAFSQAGDVFDCRGIEHRSAANGDQHVNTTHAAVTWLIGADDVPTAALLQAFRDWYRGVWLARWPNATQIVGHRDLHSTECPGPRAYALIRSGRLPGPDPAPTERNPPMATEVALTDAAVRELADRLVSETAHYRPHDPTPDDPHHLIAPVEAWGETLQIVRGLQVSMEALRVEIAALRAAVGR